MHLLIRLTHEDDQTSDFRVQPYRGITADKSSITAVTPEQLTPSPRYYRNVHRENPRCYRGITAVPITVQLSSSNAGKRRLRKTCMARW